MGDTIKELEQRAQPGQRRGMILEKLAQLDSLFDHNVPVSVRTGYDDASLLGFLENVYTKPEFVVEDPEAVKKYIEVGDRVWKKGDYTEVVATLRLNDTVEIIENVDPSKFPEEQEVKVRTDLFDWTVLRKYLWAEDKKSFWTEYRTWRYKGPVQQRHGMQIPEGAEGIVWKIEDNSYGIESKRSILVAWDRTTVADLVTTNTIYPHTDRTCKEVYFACDALRLVRRNPVQWSQLLSQIEGEIRGG